MSAALNEMMAHYFHEYPLCPTCNGFGKIQSEDGPGKFCYCPHEFCQGGFLHPTCQRHHDCVAADAWATMVGPVIGTQHCHIPDCGGCAEWIKQHQHLPAVKRVA